MKFEDLPKVNLIKIFGYLDLYDLIQKRLVNKRWSSIIANDVLYEELSIVDFFNTGKNRWYYTGQPLDFKFLLAHYENDPLPLTIYRSKLFRAMFGNLKCLRLSCVLREKEGFHLEMLNDLSTLVHLDIYTMYVIGKKNLTLPRLQVFSMNKFYAEGVDKSNILTICAKRLKILNYGKIQIFRYLLYKS